MRETRHGPKIKPRRLARKALVHPRQSGEKQGRRNLESQRLPWDLAERVRPPGWREAEISSSDRGAGAASGCACREGFERVPGAAAGGQVGTVVRRELSRLARAGKDCCRLLEAWQLFETLLGDEQQVRGRSHWDGRLMLGIKGTWSVVELKVPRQRLPEGQGSEARRGEPCRRLPAG